MVSPGHLAGSNDLGLRTLERRHHLQEKYIHSARFKFELLEIAACNTRHQAPRRGRKKTGRPRIVAPRQRRSVRWRRWWPRLSCNSRCGSGTRPQRRVRKHG